MGASRCFLSMKSAMISWMRGHSMTEVKDDVSSMVSYEARRRIFVENRLNKF